jgi:predicted glutamine amidotransferase
MCIIVVQTKNNFVSKKTLRNCWDNNGDGAGIMYANSGKIVVKKELTSFEKFMQYKNEADKIGGNIVMHFRISTSAGINLNNIHPFKVNSELHFCHNGILDIAVPKNSPINDTQIFNNQILRNLPKGFQHNHAIMDLIEQRIGDRNKFVLLDTNGQFYIINEIAGNWDEGNWYSNNSYLYSYSNVITSNYYVKNKSNKTFVDSAWEYDEIDTIESEHQKCECCYTSYKKNELIYDRYWNSFLCNDCNKDYNTIA